MNKTKAIYGDEAFDTLKEGVDQVFNAVAPTMGAKGRNAVYAQYGMTKVTNDGVTIARQIKPEDPFHDEGAQMINQAAEQTNYVAGDGTSGTIVLGKHIVDYGIDVMEVDKINPQILRKQIMVGLEKLKKELKNQSKPIKTKEELIEVAKISVEDEELAKMVAGLVYDLGVDSAIVAEETYGSTVRTEIHKGYSWDEGYVSPMMINTQKGEAIMEDCAVFVTDRYMNLATDLVNALDETVKNWGKQKILVVADNVEGELLQSIIVTKQQTGINIVAVKRPKTVQELEDIATITGATAVTQEKGIDKITAGTKEKKGHIGFAERVVVTRDKAMIVCNKYQANVDMLIKEIEAQIEAEDDEKYGIIEDLKNRLAKLKGGVARIKVGANTEAERNYKQKKLEDAIGACKSALQEGVVAGAGVTLFEMDKILDESIPGERILQKSIRQPHIQIMKNAGYTAPIDEPMKINVLTDEIVDNLIDVGIVDPAKVIRCELENAVSFAVTLLTTHCAIANIPDEVEKK